MSLSRRRLVADLELFRKQASPGLSIEVNPDNIYHISIKFPGPVQTPYQGGIFAIEMQIPHDYPFNAPIGAVCLTILKGDWSPTQNLHSVITSIQALLSSPNADDPLDTQVGDHLRKDPDGFEAQAREWTARYARDTTGVYQKVEQVHIDRFVELGFPQDTVEKVLNELRYVGQNVGKIDDNVVVDECQRLAEGFSGV
ncbi:UBC-like protein [Auricularia subglabra TFB-10046 SS5]|nr:UBC-like protein [Auricularia subglabra TFB-10046 SS5]